MKLSEVELALIEAIAVGPPCPTARIRTIEKQAGGRLGGSALDGREGWAKPGAIAVSGVETHVAVARQPQYGRPPPMVAIHGFPVDTEAKDLGITRQEQRRRNVVVRLIETRVRC